MDRSLCLRLALSLCFMRVSEQGPDQRRLLKDLMTSYTPLERPVQNDTQTLIVTFGINLMQIMDVDEKNQVLTTNIWLKMMWNASNLQWAPEDYPGVYDMTFPNDLLWKPDILLYNSADQRFDATFHTNILVQHTGHCTYIPPAIYKSTCKIDVRWFPFDEQRCELKFGSWTYNGWAIDLKMMEADLGEYIPNGEWDLVEVPGVKTDKIYPCCPEPYPDITYTVVIRRRTLFYGLNLLVPCVLISVLALLVFLLPAASGEKISLGITVLLSLTILMLLVAEIMPATSETVPLISQYFSVTMVIVGLSVMATVLVLQYHHHDPNGSKMPRWTRVFLLNWCAWFLRMKRPGDEKVRPTGLSSIDQPPNGTIAGPNTSSSNMLYVSIRDRDNSPRATLPDSCSRRLHSGEEDPLKPGSSELGLGQILEEIRFISSCLRTRDLQETVCNEWKFAASVIDRLCLITFCLLTVACTVGILVSAPDFVQAVSKDVFSN